MILNISCLNDLQDREKKFHSFNGNIVVSSLRRNVISNLEIKNGYKREKRKAAGDLVLPDSDNTLPDVTSPGRKSLL